MAETDSRKVFFNELIFSFEKVFFKYFEINKLFLKQGKRAQKIQERVDKITFQFTGNELFIKKFKREMGTIYHS